MNRVKGGFIDIHEKLLNSPTLNKLFATTPYGEYHWINSNGVTDNFTGPGTRTDIRLNSDDTPKEWSKPVDPIDNVALWHDVQYREAGNDLEKKHSADNTMIQKLNALDNLTTKQKMKRFIITKILKAKMKLGMGFADEIHREYRKQKSLLKVKVFNKDDIWSADLIDMPKEKGYRYCLTVIDLYTRYAWVVPLKNKTGITVKQSFENIMRQSNRFSKKLWVDKGTEFHNKQVKSLPFEIYSTYNDGKAVIIERFNRTIKNKLYKRFTEQGHQKWLAILPEIVDKYNNTKHSTIQTTPTAASEDPSSIKNIMFDNNFENELTLKPKKHKFKIGDRVRIFRWKGMFEKGYQKGFWTNEVFMIVKTNNTVPHTYELKDLDGEEVYGRFYENELQKTEF